MGDEGGIATAEHGGMRIDATGATSDDILESVRGEKQTPEEEQEKRSEAGKELGKAGGKASAERRAKDEKAEPEEPSEKEKSEGEQPEEKAEKSDEGKDKESEDKSDKEKKLGKPRHDPQARVEQATRQAAEAKRQLAEERERYQQLEARLEAIERGAKPTKAEEPKGDGPQEDKRPRLQDFNDFEEYEDARDQWSRRQVMRDIQSQMQQKSAASEQDQAFNLYLEKVKDRLKTAEIQLTDEGIGAFLPSYYLEPNQEPTVENWIADEFLSVPDDAPGLWNYFQENPDELQRLTALTSDRAVTREMARIRVKLETPEPAPEPEDNFKSDATPPPKQVRGHAPAPSTDPNPLPGEDFDTYRRRTKHLKKNL